MAEQHSYQRTGDGQFAVGTGRGDSFQSIQVFPTEADAMAQVRFLDEEAKEQAKAKDKPAAKAADDEGPAKSASRPKP
jgi:hypothetical protein